MADTPFGNGDVLIRVDMTRGEIRVERFPDEWMLLGGRALSAKILLETVDPKCDPGTGQ